MNFEPTSSFCYNFARYTVLPAVDQLEEVLSGEPFLLRELVFKIVDQHLTKDQQAERVPFKESEGSDSVRGYIRFWSSVVAKDTKRYFDLGKGRYRLMTDGDISETEMIDSAIEDGDAVAALVQQVGQHNGKSLATPSYKRKNNHSDIGLPLGSA